MSRSQQASGTLVAIGSTAYSIEDAIADDELENEAKNINTIWGQRSPDLVQQTCIGDASNREIEVTDAALTTRYYWIVPSGEYGSRDQFKAEIQYYTSDGSTTGEIELRSIREGDPHITTLAATTSTAWLELNSVDCDNSNKTEIIRLQAKRTAGTGTIYIRTIHGWMEPQSGELPTGVEASGFEACDTIQYDADSPCSAGNVKRIQTNQQHLMDKFSAPVACQSIDWQGTKNAFVTSATTLTIMVGPLQVYERAGENITELRYYLFPVCPAAVTGTITIEAQGLGGLIGAVDTHAVTNGAAPETPGDWLTGTIPLYGSTTVSTSVVIRARTDSGAGGVGLRSWALFAEHRS